jgi:hypothetical protein
MTCDRATASSEAGSRSSLKSTDSCTSILYARHVFLLVMLTSHFETQGVCRRARQTCGVAATARSGLLGMDESKQPAWLTSECSRNRFSPYLQTHFNVCPSSESALDVTSSSASSDREQRQTPIEMCKTSTQGYLSFANSTFACFRRGTSGSAFFHRLRKSL